MDVIPKQVITYVTTAGKDVFNDWLDELKDKKVRGLIRTRIDRIEEGNLGDYKSLGNGLFEMRIHYRGGYRVYFSNLKWTLVVLLCGGGKSTQAKDIDKSREYLADFRRRYEKII